jgi:hypothetical protein
MIEVFIRYRVQYRIAISGHNDIKGKNSEVGNDIGAMLGYKDIDIFSSTSKTWSVPVWTAGWSRWAVLISSYRSTSDVMWSFGRGKPRLVGLRVKKTFERQVAAGEASKERGAENRRRLGRKADKA